MRDLGDLFGFFRSANLAGECLRAGCLAGRGLCDLARIKCMRLFRDGLLSGQDHSADGALCSGGESGF